MNRVRIFISSPGDVAEERNIAQKVVEALQVEFADVLELESLLWEQEPLLASADFQSQIRSPADFDIFATIIGARLGSPLGDQFTRDDGTTYASGTEFEFEVALNSFYAKGAPELLVYRKRTPTQSEQLGLVDGFFAKWFMDAHSNTATGAYHWFDEARQFEEVFTLHLRKLLRRFLPKPNNIPEPISTFVGRRELISQTKAHLFESNTRILTLTGAGGTGKSRLALRIARDVLPDFEDGTFFVALANIRDANLVPAAIAAAMSVRQADGQDMLTTLIEELRNKNTLLVLDNLEQIDAAGSLLNNLVSNCPNLKILATTRALLRLSGVVSITVPPFDVPDSRRASLQSARDSDAVALFVNRAKTVRGDFDLTEENFRQVLDICRQLDGLPLTIELATSRLRSMDTTRLLKAMDKRFAVLKGGTDDLLDHQKSLRELVTWSYELLSHEQQMLWRRMAVFAGSFTMEAAEDVCDPEDEFIVDIEVEGLADSSLATIKIADEPRVQMLGTLREFALEQLREAGEYDDYQDRLIDWACRKSDYFGTALEGSSADKTLIEVDLEHENFLEALNQCKKRSDDRLLQIASGLWYHWFERGYMSFASELLKPLLEDESNESIYRARALKGLGSIARFQKELDSATRCCSIAHQLFTQHGDVGGEASALGELGAIEISRGNLDTASEHLSAAIDIRESNAPNEGHLSFLLATLGVVEHLRDNLSSAKTYYSRALDIGSKLGDLDSRASALVNMGEIAEAEGDIEAAYKYYQESLNLFYERGKKVAIAYCAEVLAGLSSRHLSKPEHAALLLGFSASLREELNTPIEPFNEARLAADIAQTKEVLGADNFRTQWLNGEGLHLEDFLSYMEAHASS